MRDALEQAREHVAGLVGVTPREVVFTSGGTEADQCGRVGRDGGAAAARAAPISVADVEHSAVRDASARSGPVEVIPVDATARLDLGLARGAPAVLRRWPARPWCTASGPTTKWARCNRCTRWCGCAGAPACRCMSTRWRPAATCRSTSGRSAPTWSASVPTKSAASRAPAHCWSVGATGCEPFVVGGEQERARRAGLEAVPALVAFGAAAAVLGRRRATGPATTR